MAGQTVSEIYCWQLQLGELNVHLASTEKGALRIGLTLEAQSDCISFFKPLFPENRLLRDSRPNGPLIQGVDAALWNCPVPYDMGVDFTCTKFQWLVMRAITLIPFGETRSYGEVACMVGRPEGARAVGQALGRNPLPVIFP